MPANSWLTNRAECVYLGSVTLVDEAVDPEVLFKSAVIVMSAPPGLTTATPLSVALE
jgi:hypothetical protein